MSSRRVSRTGARVVLLLMVLALAASAATIDIGTDAANLSNWSITAGYGYGGAAATATGTAVGPSGLISVDTSGKGTGTFFNSAVTNANFNGWWEATLTFAIPSGATSASLAFSNLAADDRAVLELNGTQIGDQAINGGSGSGVMCFSYSTNCGSFTWTPTTSGTITLTAGTTYTLQVFVNNTGTGNITSQLEAAYAPSYVGLSGGDATAVQLVGDVTYQSSTTPEPGSWSFILLGLGSTAIGLLRRRSA